MQPLRIETTVAELASELRRHGVGADERVTLTITSPEDRASDRASERAAGGAYGPGPRAAVVAVGLSDEDIDRLIEQAEREIDLEDA